MELPRGPRGPLSVYLPARSLIRRGVLKNLEGEVLESGLDPMGGGFGLSWESSGISQSEYEAAMAERYANTRIGTGPNDYGYTGQGVTSRAGIRAASNPYVHGSKINGPLGSSSNPRRNYGVTGKRVIGGR